MYFVYVHFNLIFDYYTSLMVLLPYTMYTCTLLHMYRLHTPHTSTVHTTLTPTPCTPHLLHTVFAQVLAGFRYGRDDLDVLGLNFRRDLIDVSTLQARFAYGCSVTIVTMCMSVLACLCTYP